MINRHPNLCWRRMLRLALCYVIALQAFLSAFETTIAAAHAPTSDVSPVICHAVDGRSPSNGDTGNPEKIACALCALAAAALALLCNPVSATEALLLPAGLVGFPHAISAAHHPRARAGYSRAPPSFA